MATSYAARRQVQVLVTDAAGQPFYGARLDFYHRDRNVGSLIDSTGVAVIDCPGEVAVDVRVTAAGQQQMVRIGPDDTQLNVTFPILRASATVPIPTAECPDGTQGQPCVNCPLGSSTIRICG
jgi:hypothetical protein